MKNSRLKKLSLLLGLVLLCTLTACSGSAKLLRLKGAERADYFFDLVNNEPTDKYLIDMQMDITGSVYSVAFEAKITSETYYINYDGDSPTYHAEGESIIVMGTGNSTVTHTTKSVFGYRDGKMYEYSDNDGVESALVSAISADDYKKHTDTIAGMTDKEISELHKSAAKKECKQNEDGSWTATYSDYEEKSVSGIIDYCFDSTVTVIDGYKVKDVILEINATEEFIPTEWKYELVFERIDETELYKEPKAIIVMSFENIGTAEAPEVDFSAYTEVEDLAALREIRNLINDMTVSKSGSFTSKSNQNVKYMHTTTNTDETDIVTYNSDNGKFSFNIDTYLVAPGMSVNNGSDYKLVYKDGILTVSGDGIKSDTQEMTNNDAKVYVVSILDPAGLASATVSNITAGSYGYTHTFTIVDPDYSALLPTLTSLGAKDIKAEATVDVIYEDGKLKEYQYKLTVTSKVQLETLTIKITTTVTFESNDNAEL